MISRREGSRIVLPGLASAHSHAFQRALRGRTQRRATEAGDFWSWRGLMYEVATKLDPESIYDVSHFAFVEMALAGYTCVGEFHYLHHQADGAPYADRLTLADAVIRAARDAGLRLTLMRTFYSRAGHGRPPEPGQRRFCDPSVELALADVEALVARTKGDPLVSIGLAPHSLRAVPKEWVSEASSLARALAAPLQMHVSEQPREVTECIEEHGSRPVHVLAELGVLARDRGAPRFVGVHLNHIDAEEAARWVEEGALACICRSTERDLGDGDPASARLAAAGAREVCTGIDSHSITDPFEDMRSVELDARTGAGARHAAFEASVLLEGASAHAYAALGARVDGDRVELDGADPSLADADDALLDDAVVFGASPRAVRDVYVAGRPIVQDGEHPRYGEARERYVRALRRMGV